MPELALLGGPRAVRTRFDPLAHPRFAQMNEEVRRRTVEAVDRLMREGRTSIPDGSGVVAELEERFAAWVGTRYALAQCNGTSTLHAALYALGVGPGDEVIVPSYTWVASVSPIIASRAVPVFCEVDPQTLCADPADIERRVTERTRAVIVVHLWGHPADMDAVLQVARSRGIGVVEDCSHAHGALYKGRPVGSIGDVGCFSLQGSKPLSAGEGGMLVTNDPDLYDRALALGHQGRPASRHVTGRFAKYAFTGLGFKYRIHPFAAAMALVGLDYIDEKNALRAQYLGRLTRRLEGVPGMQVLHTREGCVRGGFYEYRALCRPEDLGGLPTARYIDALAAEGVPVRPERYTLQHLEPAFRGDEEPFPGGSGSLRRRVWRKGDLPVTEALYERLLAFPPDIYQEDLIEEIGRAAEKVASHLEELAEYRA